MDVLFVDLPFNTYELGRKFKTAWSFKQQISSYELHLGFRYMVSALQEHHFTADIIYPSKETEIQTKTDLLKAVCAIQPLILAFTSYEGTFRETLQFIRKVKARGVRSLICVGGHLATFSYREILADFPDLVNVVVLGEGEHTIVELTAAVKEKNDYQAVRGIAYFDGCQVVTTAARPVERAIDSFPFPIMPERKDWAKRTIPLFITSSRGCYGRCSFCRSLLVNERWRSRSPENVVDEIEAAYRQGITIFEFVDDNFLGPGKVGRERAVKIAEEIKRRNLSIQYHLSCRVNDVDEPTVRVLKESGLFSASLGVELGVQRMLDTFNKNITVAQSYTALEILDKLGISIQVYIIFFDPYMTLAEVRENVRFLQAIRELENVRFEGVIFRKLIPISGTAIFDQLKHDKLLRGNYLAGHSFKFKDPLVAVFADFMETIDIRFERIYQDPAYRSINYLYELFKEQFEFSFAEKALDLIQGSRMKRAEAFAKMNDLLSLELRRTFSKREERVYVPE